MNKSMSLLLSAVLLAAPLAVAEGEAVDVGDGAETVATEERAADSEQRARAREDRALRDEKFGISKQQRAQMRRIRQRGGSREAISAVLSEEQREQVRQWRQENREKTSQDNKSNTGNKANQSNPDGQATTGAESGS